MNQFVPSRVSTLEVADSGVVKNRWLLICSEPPKGRSSDDLDYLAVWAKRRLRKIPLFQQVSQSLMRELCDYFQVVKMKKGDTVFRQGDHVTTQSLSHARMQTHPHGHIHPLILILQY